MAMIKSCGKESLNPKHIVSYVKYKFNFARNNPHYFDADGLLCFVGGQGSGKTLSAVNYIYKLLVKYPNCKLVTNVKLTDYPIVTYQEFINKNAEYYELLSLSDNDKEYKEKKGFEYYVKNNSVFPFMDNDDFLKYSNGDKGVVFFVDEIQLYLNSLESKNVNMDTMTQISQQRKQRKHIVCTSQVFGRMAKPLREQFSNVVLCKEYLGFIQYNCLIDRDSLETDSSSDTNLKGEVKQRFIWLHNPSMYKRYDTYYVIEKGKFVSGEKQKEGVYQNDFGLPTNS